MPADYRGTIRHARRWVDMCARDMPWLDVRYVTREDRSILTGLEAAFLRNGAPVGHVSLSSRMNCWRRWRSRARG